MSEGDWTRMISAMHGSGRQAVLAITGGGSGAIAELLRVPGGSRLLLEAIVPYDTGSLASFLGYEPAQASSVDTAVAMARRARGRAARFAAPGTQRVGLGATAGLVTDRPRQGEHRCHVAVVTDGGTDVHSIVLEKGRRDRAAEEDLVARVIVACLARGCGVEAASPPAWLGAGDRYTTEHIATTDPIERLVEGHIERVTAWPDGQLVAAAPPPGAVLAGSFNPLHDGHLQLARVAADLLQTPVAMEISVTNVDKPTLAADEVRARVAQFAWRATVELTRARTFLEKSRLFPGATFVVGADTAERLVAPRYYGDDHARMTGALEEISERGCRFLVAARADDTGRVRSQADVAVPRALTHLFTAIPEREFRVDISSSDIRARRRDAS